MRALLILTATMIATPQAAGAQSMPGMDMTGHEHHAPPPADPPMEMDHAAMGHGMKGMLGPYPMTRDASGTAWQPDSAPMLAIMGRAGDWSTMIHGFATLAHDDQGGPRGDDKTFVASMLMVMGQRPLGGG
ncbi:MAG: hypothetical protein EON55_17300, partial [Alphaproteobacteria bacterium]